jgi:hypothetical protein
MFAMILCVMNGSQREGEEEIFVEKITKSTYGLPFMSCPNTVEEEEMLHRVVVEMLQADDNDGGRAVEVKFYDSDIAFKTDDERNGRKTRVYVANHCGLEPTACDNEIFVNEMEGFDCKRVCLSEVARNKMIRLDKRMKAYLEELALEHATDVLKPTGLTECKSLQLLIGSVLCCDKK